MAWVQVDIATQTTTPSNNSNVSYDFCRNRQVCKYYFDFERRFAEESSLINLIPPQRAHFGSSIAIDPSYMSEIENQLTTITYTQYTNSHNNVCRYLRYEVSAIGTRRFVMFIHLHIVLFRSKSVIVVVMLFR